MGKGTRTVLVPLPPAVGRAIDLKTAERTDAIVLATVVSVRPVDKCF
ncbi:hypothetical protein [Actinomadura soli]|nr:hypothetical protein [Actinomadura soli]